MPFWASGLISFAVKLVTQWLANLRAEQALRDLGAAQQANASRVEAERQETQDSAVGATAADGPDNPDDILPEASR